MSQIDLSDFSFAQRVRLLQLLCEKQCTASFLFARGIPAPQFNRSAAEEAIKAGSIDYFQGKAIKTDLSAGSVNTYLYDRDAGVGTFQKAVDQVRGEDKYRV